MTHLGDPTPGSDTRLPPRAWLRSDAPVQSLDGDWAFLLHDADPHDDLDGPPPFAAVDADVSAWDRIPVPSHWGLYGHGHPTYTNIRYPFPLDPPHVPDANPTGDHRRTFTWHPSFCPDGRTLLRFEGVESLATVWLNGTEIGWFTGSRLMTEFDVTDHLVDGENVLAVRVHQWSAASYLEDQDQWWLPGIFRSVSLQGRPANGLDDVFVRGDRDPATGAGTLDVRPRGGWPVTVRVPELGIDETWASPSEVVPLTAEAVDAWTAATPRLYDVEVSTDAETLCLPAGFPLSWTVVDRLIADRSDQRV